MSRDAAIEHWFESMSKSELIDQCFLWHDTALEHGRMYNAIKDENAKLRELVRMMWKPFCWAQSGYEVCLTHEQDVAIRRRVCELEVEVGE